MKKLFCFGFGYTADYLSHALQDDPNWTMAGTTRTEEKQTEIAERNIEAHMFDYKVPLPDPKKTLQDVTHVLLSTPPDDMGDPTLLAHAKAIIEMPNVQWIGYLSTSGVYGDRNGGQVDENSELRPTSKRGSRRKLAEKQWMELYKQHNLPIHIYRLSGIYGPGRCALDSVRAGMARRINKPGHKFNRIHVEDIINVILTSFEKPQPGEIYNICDDLPAPSHEVIEYACKLLKIKPPALVDFEEADLAPMTRSFYMDNRRTINKKIKEQLGVTLKYPTYKEGLQACLEAENYAVSMFKNLRLQN